MVHTKRHNKRCVEGLREATTNDEKQRDSPGFGSRKQSLRDFEEKRGEREKKRAHTTAEAPEGGPPSGRPLAEKYV